MAKGERSVRYQRILLKLSGDALVVVFCPAVVAIHDDGDMTWNSKLRHKPQTSMRSASFSCSN